MSSKYGAALSAHPNAAAATGEVVADVLAVTGPGPDLALLFATGHSASDLAAICQAVTSLLAPGTLVAVDAGGVVGGGREIDRGPALSLWAGRTGAVRSFRLGPAGAFGLPSLSDGEVVVLLADPSSIAVDPVLGTIADHAPGVLVSGGLVSSSAADGTPFLWRNGEQFSDGAVGIVLPAGLAEPIVSPGTLPIGSPWVVTASDRHLVRELGGRPAFERFNEMVESLDPATRQQASQSLHVGIVANHRQGPPEPGDFLVRRVLGADRNTGAIAISSEVSVGDVIQFQVRDAVTASSELGLLMADAGAEIEGGLGEAAPAEEAALVFTCAARGMNLFGELGRDVEVVTDFCPTAAGLFCVGEIGPIGGRSALHTLTASVLRFT